MKCIVCDKKVIGRLSPDLDINGIGFCKKHKEQVMFGYICLLQGDEKLAEGFFKHKKGSK